LISNKIVSKEKMDILLILSVLFFLNIKQACCKCESDLSCGLFQGYCNKDLKRCQCIMGFSLNNQEACEIQSNQKGYF
jgi:hypothetical protein